jgi:hypothetical protein
MRTHIVDNLLSKCGISPRLQTGGKQQRMNASQRTPPDENGTKAGGHTSACARELARYTRGGKGSGGGGRWETVTGSTTLSAATGDAAMSVAAYGVTPWPPNIEVSTARLPVIPLPIEHCL